MSADGESQDMGIDIIGDMEVHYDTEIKIVDMEYK